MNAFIKKHEYNYIKKCLDDLNNSFRLCVDKDIIEANKLYLHEKILNLFSNLSKEQKELLDITKITDSLYIDKFSNDLDEYVYGMTSVTNGQLSRLFKKEKKLKLPNQNIQENKNVYLGWLDTSSNKLFVAYNMNDTILGMSCRITNSDSKNAHRCVFCNAVGKENEVTFVSPICKTSNSSNGGYKSLGFDMCLDSEKCNERIMSVEKLEKILKEVNNIK